ncbi:MAG: metal-dependent hydrolase [Methylicorpusculum sp.]|uniref:metal-dependent hydrolase n=1 Tax=Methylicorpusculum sp. TaxID=2713644 RepID=UPI002719429A|nr:metal-dependent hydrolase [Methylicorpusculum sp.]MDO8843752.1 metal-dependent hydrolase [Methylicorpusculum sp.]MDO8938476.1 metal-dependent hydrolase [Methylicorpusculum sp.]MDP2200411.1 metal-dependent hydrolase [Methylicorpusculum sp.]
MANFKTHLSVATFASTAFAGGLYQISIVDAVDIPRLIFFGVIGGLLPDVDAENSVPARRLFNSLAFLAAGLILSRQTNLIPTKQLFLYAVIAALLIRFPLFYLFNKTTKHRGVFHSLLGALFFGFLVTCLSHWFLDWDSLQSWYNGIFIGFGFIVHLCLDEIYSVNLSGFRMKKSFGTALKLFSYNDMLASGLLLVAVMALMSVTPSAESLGRVLAQTNWGEVARMGSQLLKSLH